MLTFLTDLFETGFGYSAIHTAKSALAAIVQLPDGPKLGSHPLIAWFMKGLVEIKISLPKYSTTWDVSSVLIFFTNDGVAYQGTEGVNHETCIIIAVSADRSAVANHVTDKNQHHGIQVKQLSA